MSVEEIPIIRLVADRLHDLLAHARKLKPNAIEPPLEGTSIDEDIQNLTIIPEEGDTSEGQPPAKTHYNAVETVARNIFYETLGACTIDQPEFVDVWNLLDILQLCADHEKCEASLALWLVEELLDSQTIDGCRKVFDYLESRRERLITNAFSSGKQLVLLRSCNELLRRLSRAEDAVFCGRVFIFLFQSFPLGDKSAVNLRGEFHVENLTAYDDVPQVGQEEDAGDHMEVDTEEAAEEARALKAEDEVTMKKKDGETNGTNETGKSKIKTQKEPLPDKVDFASLYSKFWSLQQIFSNPTKAFGQDDLAKFKNSLELTIKAFRAAPKVVSTRGTSRQGDAGTKTLKRKRSRETDELASPFNPKYLTNRDLFELELSDLTFQRHILVQALILLEFLLTLTAKGKKQLAALKAQKAMIFNYTLSDEDAIWVTSMRTTIANYLQEGPDGKFYYRMVDNVLSRDKNWVRWKAESCPPITKDPISTENYVTARSGLKRTFANKRLRPTPLGAMDLSFLSDTQNVNSLDKLQDRTKFSVPSTETYLRDIVDIDFDLEGAGSKEKLGFVEARASKTWRVLRIAMKSKLALFGKVDEAKSLDSLNDNPSAVSREAEEAEEDDGTAGLDGEEAAKTTKTVRNDDDKPMQDATESDDPASNIKEAVSLQEEAGVEAASTNEVKEEESNAEAATAEEAKA